jgi:hypothetical protein
MLRGEIKKIQTLTASCNIEQKNSKKISKPSSSCNMRRDGIKKIQRLVFSVGKNALCCNGEVGSCIFSAKKSSIVQLEMTICIFTARKPSILQLAERTCIFSCRTHAMLQMALGRRETSGSALYFLLQKQSYIETDAHVRLRTCIFFCRTHAMLKHARKKTFKRPSAHKNPHPGGRGFCAIAFIFSGPL